jgi:hypothetical protein
VPLNSALERWSGEISYDAKLVAAAQLSHYATSHSSMKIRIKSTPPGEAPENIRQAWIGLEIPVPPRFAERRNVFGVGVLSGPTTWLGQLIAILMGRAQRESGYVVEARVAVDLLSIRSPEAADWWRQHAPQLIAPGKYLLFAAEACEEIHENTA